MTVLLQQTWNSESLAQGDPPGTSPGKRLSPRPESVGSPGARPSQAARQGAVSHCGDDRTSLRAHCTPTPGTPGVGCSPTESFPPLCLGFQPETEVLRVGPQERALCAGCGKPHGWGPRGVPTGRRGPIGDWGSCRKATPCTRKNSRATARGSRSPFPTSHLCPSPDTGCRASLPRPLWCHHNSTRRCLGNSPTVPLARCSGWWDPWVSADHTQDPPGRHAAGL